jgi:hypothetical protein
LPIPELSPNGKNPDHELQKVPSQKMKMGRHAFPFWNNNTSMDPMEFWLETCRPGNPSYIVQTELIHDAEPS